MPEKFGSNSQPVLKNAWNVRSWTLTEEEIVATGMIFIFLFYTCVQEKKISWKRTEAALIA